jgi:hypothetical protein
MERVRACLLRGAASSTLALVLLTARSARAFERQWHAGVDAGYAQLFGQGGSPGFGGGAHLAYGMSDMFNALLELDLSRHPDASSTVYNLVGGFAYTLDVAQAVPYFGLLAGPYVTRGDVEKTAFMFQFALGLDYLIERNWAIGLQFRMPIASLTPDARTVFSVSADDTHGYSTTMLRVEYLWGF